MMKKPQRHGAFTLPITQVVREGPPTRDPVNLRTMRKEIHLLESSLRSEQGGITELRELLISRTSEEHWEVPG